MATRRARRDAATLTDLILRTATAVGDVMDGARPAAGSRKWEDSAIVTAINDMMAEMYLELHTTPDQVIQEAAFTYTGDADEVQLGASQGTTWPIYAVFKEINGVRTLLRHVPYHTIQRYDTDGADPAYETESVWSRRDDYILLRPVPGSDVTLTLAIIGSPFGMDSATPTDQHPFPVAHEELLVLGAANRLQYPNDQLPIGRQIHYNKLWTKWLQDCDRYQGARFPVDTRRYK